MSEYLGNNVKVEAQDGEDLTADDMKHVEMMAELWKEMHEEGFTNMVSICGVSHDVILAFAQYMELEASEALAGQPEGKTLRDHPEILASTGIVLGLRLAKRLVVERLANG